MAQIGSVGQPRPGYPVAYEVDYPDFHNRTRVLLRPVLVLPILALYAIVVGGLDAAPIDAAFSSEFLVLPYAGGMFVGGGGTFFPPMIMIVVRHKYPRWWFDWNLELTRFVARIAAYACLLRDEYPSTDDHQAVHLTIVYPDVDQDLSRWLPPVKWILVFPHFGILFWLVLAAILAVMLAWICILITGRCPRMIWEFIVGVQRWGFRVSAYAFLLVTDRYPPFSLR